MTYEDNTTVEGIKTRDVGIMFAGKFTQKQEEAVMDLSMEYIKQLKAICNEIQLTFEFNSV